MSMGKQYTTLSLRRSRKELNKMKMNHSQISEENKKKNNFITSNKEQKGSKGMGIGLSLVKKILTIFKGRIWVEDKIKDDYTKGSNFIVLLPEVKRLKKNRICIILNLAKLSSFMKEDL